MVRKIIGVCIAIGLFFTLTLDAAASPLSTTDVSNIYTEAVETQTESLTASFPVYRTGLLPHQHIAHFIVEAAQGDASVSTTLAKSNENAEFIFD